MLLLVNLPLKTTFLWIQTQHSSVTEDRQWLAGWLARHAGLLLLAVLSCW